jgi:hemerythrin superfamily protein
MPNATQVLRQDHKKVEGLFKKFEQARGGASKRRIAEQAMTELEIHAKIEEEIFYPAVKSELDEAGLVEEAKQEHQTVKQLIRELKTMDAEDEEFESKFSELVDNVKHHVEEEQGEMFPKVEDSDMDLADVGEQLAERKHELMATTDGAGTKAKSKSKSKSRSRTKSRSSRKSKSARRSSTARRAR